jgi:hypothetical protein
LIYIMVRPTSLQSIFEMPDNTPNLCPTLYTSSKSYCVVVIALVVAIASPIMNPVYLPSFLSNIDSLDGTALSGVKDEDWLTDDLKEKITSYFPNFNDISDERARYNLSFENHAEELCLKDRIFASFVQLCVAVDMVLKACGASSSHGSTCLTSFHGKLSRKSSTSVVEPDKQQVQTSSLKELLLRSFILSRRRRIQEGAQ